MPGAGLDAEDEHANRRLSLRRRGDARPRAGPPAPQARRSQQADVWDVHERLIELGVRAESLGYDSYWLAEHHFQYEGYETVPNGILLGAFVAARTSRIRIGTLFNIVPQWHPLRLAEDFAILHNLSGGQRGPRRRPWHRAA